LSEKLELICGGYVIRFTYKMFEWQTMLSSVQTTGQSHTLITKRHSVCIRKWKTWCSR